MFGVKKEDVLGRNFMAMITPDPPENTLLPIWAKTDKTHGNYETLESHQSVDGSLIRCRWHTNAVYNDNDEIISFISLGANVTELEEAKEKLNHLANHDALTNLPSLRLGKDRLQQAINSIKRNKLTMAVMFCDLDGFKPINDKYGHATGDVILKEIANRITNILRVTDTIARIGGDEFMIVLTDIKEIEAIHNIAKKIIKSVSEPIIYNNHQCIVGVSIGIALHRSWTNSGDELLKQADEAMYKAKANGKGSFMFYDDL